MRNALLTATVLCALASAALAQEPARTVAAVRLVGQAPEIDGRLDSTWLRAPVANGFTQRRPTEGAPARFFATID